MTDETEGQRALGSMMRYHGMLQQLTPDNPDYAEFVARKLLFAAEALNSGTVDPATIQTLARWTDFEMRELRKVAAEQIDDEADVEENMRAAIARGDIAPPPRAPHRTPDPA